MTDYSELVKALRYCSHDGLVKCNECRYGGIEWPIGCEEEMMQDAAAAIEALEAANKELSEELLEAQIEKPHWISAELPPKVNGTFAACCVYDGKIYWFKAIYLDGKWLREMDGVELPVNYWMEIPQPPQEVQDGQ